MSGPIDMAAKGLVRAQEQLAQSAARVVARPALKGGASFDAAQQSFAPKQPSKPDGNAEPRRSGPSSNTSKAPIGDAAVTSQGSYLPSLAEETVQMRIAANAYSANAKLMQAAEDIIKITQDAFSAAKDDSAADE